MHSDQFKPKSYLKLIKKKYIISEGEQFPLMSLLSKVDFSGMCDRTCTHDKLAALGAGVEFAVVEAHAGDIATLLLVISHCGNQTQLMTHLKPTGTQTRVRRVKKGPIQC